MGIAYSSDAANLQQSVQTPEEVRTSLGTLIRLVGFRYLSLEQHVTCARVLGMLVIVGMHQISHGTPYSSNNAQEV